MELTFSSLQEHGCLLKYGKLDPYETVNFFKRLLHGLKCLIQIIFRSWVREGYKLLLAVFVFF